MAISMLDDSEGASWSARNKARQNQLRRHVQERKKQLNEKQRRKDNEERRLVDEYLELVKQEREAKKEEIQLRLAALSSRQRQQASATKPSSAVVGSPSSALGHQRSQSHVPGTESEEAAEITTPREPLVQEPSKQQGSQSARGPRSSKDSLMLRKDRGAKDATGAQTDDKVPHLYKTLGLGAMVADFEQLEQQGGGGFRKMPNLKPQQPLKAETGDDEGSGGDEKRKAAEEEYLRSQRNLARRQRLRLIRQVAAEVLDCKKQLAASSPFQPVR
mmetsp:Transcript_55041/g.98140  ORF Transcript_55041/g.98140 Transcript_55041/m.98140 type:complete len:274 (-) Transcript_55041:124-945(-)